MCKENITRKPPFILDKIIYFKKNLQKNNFISTEDRVTIGVFSVFILQDWKYAQICFNFSLDVGVFGFGLNCRTESIKNIHYVGCFRHVLVDIKFYLGKS